MGSPYAQAIIKQVSRDLPALPSVTSRLLEATNREFVSAHEIEVILGHDVGLATKTLRVVNSAYYGLPGHVRNLGQAVVILGVKQVQTLALGLAAFDVLGQDPRMHSQMDVLWRHSIETSVTAEFVAKFMQTDAQAQEQAAMVGLLHDAGRLLLLAYFPKSYLELGNETHSASAIRAKFSADQYEIGAALFAHWGLPQSLADQVAGLSRNPIDDRACMSVSIAHAILMQEDPPCGCGTDLGPLRDAINEKLHAISETYGMEAA